MPVLAKFSGITMRMYFQQAEHNPPHVHGKYGEQMVAVAIRDGAVLDGAVPPKILQKIEIWVEQNREELLEIWETQEFKALPPLK